MLTKKIPEATGGVTDMLALDEQITETALHSDDAANAADFRHAKMQLRRLRRQSRQARIGARRIGGWSVSSW